MYYHNFLVILATFNEYHWSFFTSGSQISYKTNTVGRSVFIIAFLITIEILKNSVTPKLFNIRKCDNLLYSNFGVTEFF